MDKEDQVINLEELKRRHNNLSNKERNILNEILKCHANNAHIEKLDLVDEIIKIIKGQIK